MNTDTLQFNLPATTDNGQARKASLNAVSVETTPTSLVAYSSLGRLLIVGPRNTALEAYSHMHGIDCQCFLLVTEDTASNGNGQLMSEEILPDIFVAESYSLTGFLGSFSVLALKNDREFNLGKTVGIESGMFDLILDLSDSATIGAELPPPGYFWLDPEQRNEARIKQTADEISQLVGKFEKPKFYNYDPDICAHSRSGIIACTRCIDACPTDAITSIGEMIEVNSHLCQGGGSCATSCPTGAITYAYPTAADQLEILRQLLLNYRQSGGGAPVILFFDREHGYPLVEASISSLGENVLPVEVEEIGSLGLDIYLGILAYGSAGAGILGVNLANSVRSELKHQIALLNELLSGLGYATEPVQLLEMDTVEDLSDSVVQELARMDVASAKFAPTGIKRTDMRIALEHLHDLSPLKPAIIELPENSPFGEIQVDLNTCTLCMGCVSVCPASALEAGGEVPKLSFIENNCVQCGLCESACPENSITRHARYIFETDARMRARALNEDSPFHCRMCGKAFATNVMLNRMKDKLKGHWMFQDAAAVARLELCEDCRVKDMFAAEGGFPRHKL